ncbi:hypothetical protein EDB19DRAFT_883075 [Suillus lakei]|nr:hypothetical protein EDB19DRAFT_883075 [Suillus lakei]
MIWSVSCYTCPRVLSISTMHSASAHSLPSCKSRYFSGLRKVNLSLFCMSWLDEDVLGSIVMSWPRLECLDLRTAYYWQTPPKVTFQGLVALLSSCPNLRRLGLLFNATRIEPPTAEKPGGGVCNIDFTTFWVGRSLIKQPLIGQAGGEFPRLIHKLWAWSSVVLQRRSPVICQGFF